MNNKTIALWLAVILLAFVCVYMVMNIEEMKASDFRYCAKKADVSCHCWNYEKNIDFLVNSTTISVIEQVMSDDIITIKP